MSFRSWLTLITLVLLGGVVVAAWPEILKAWRLTDHIDWWILSLMIPVQLASYYANGGTIFSYLSSKGNLKHLSQWMMARMSLELNFVNHVFPSGGAAGVSYMGWLLGKHGVSAGRATISQLIRYVLTFISFVCLLLVAVVILTLDGAISRFVILLSFFLVLGCVGVIIAAIYLLGNKRRLERFSVWLVQKVNRLIRKLTRGKKQGSLKEAPINAFFMDLHQDYIEIMRDKKILIKPFIWSMMANVLDVVLLWVAFWALGTPVDPATLVVAFGVAGVSSIISVTPGNAGVYEVVMIAILASGGVQPDIAIAGTLLARVVLVLGTIVFGYFFYQLTLVKYGKRPTES